MVLFLPQPPTAGDPDLVVENELSFVEEVMLW